MKRFQNLILLALVAALMVAPLLMVKKPAPGPDGKEVEIFAGADDQASNAISTIDPSYKRWISPFFEPPSGEIESLLFALQAALGAGFIGYWLGTAKTRAKYEQAGKKPA